MTMLEHQMENNRSQSVGAGGVTAGVSRARAPHPPCYVSYIALKPKGLFQLPLSHLTPLESWDDIISQCPTPAWGAALSNKLGHIT